MGCTPCKTAAAAKVEEPSASTLLQTTQGQVVEAEAVKAEEQKTDAEMVKETAQLKLQTAEVKQKTAEVKQELEQKQELQQELKQKQAELNQETVELEQELNELMKLTITEVKPKETPAQSCWMGCCDSTFFQLTITARRSNQRRSLLRASG
ncbi:unnamed protein product [Polarella glacialis]|uniref:Uncharacterized protein n=1 Tax=Polarella glacialis TaxID=89957 RepID=A0A813LA74_POLGL|nr:unnamed protein product [Polarella glacialis]